MTSRQVQFLNQTRFIMKATHVAQGNTESSPRRYSCVIAGCKNTFVFPYGRWADGGTCTGKCERAKEKLVREAQEMHNGLKAA